MKMDDQSLTHRFRNNAKAVEVGNPAWQAAADNQLLDNSVRYIGNDRLERQSDGHRFINMISCSYLGLHSHPWVLEGARAAIDSEQTFALSASRLRIRFSIIDELEAGLSALYRARCVSAISTAVASAAVLPLIASGHLTDDGEPRVMVFDKFSHFSLNYIKPICADEAPVYTSPHNDLNYLEDMCKKHKRVAYVADGAYSLGGIAPVKELMELQDRYGLFLFFDEAHSLSMYGERGEGIVRSMMPERAQPADRSSSPRSEKPSAPAAGSSCWAPRNTTTFSCDSAARWRGPSRERADDRRLPGFVARAQFTRAGTATATTARQRRPVRQPDLHPAGRHGDPDPAYPDR